MPLTVTQFCDHLQTYQQERLKGRIMAWSPHLEIGRLPTDWPSANFAALFDSICKHQVPVVDTLFQYHTTTIFALNQSQLAKLKRIQMHWLQHGRTLFNGHTLSQRLNTSAQLHPDLKSKRFYADILLDLFMPPLEKLPTSSSAHLFLEGLPPLFAILHQDAKLYERAFKHMLHYWTPTSSPAELSTLLRCFTLYAKTRPVTVPGITEAMHRLHQLGARFSYDLLVQLSSTAQKHIPITRFVVSLLTPAEVFEFFKCSSPLQILISTKLLSKPDLALELLTNQGLSLHEAAALLHGLEDTASQDTISPRNHK